MDTSHAPLQYRFTYKTLYYMSQKIVLKFDSLLSKHGKEQDPGCLLRMSENNVTLVKTL